MKFDYSLSLLAYLSLAISVLSFWVVRKVAIWLAFLLVAMACLFFDARLSLLTLGVLLAYAGLGYCAFKIQQPTVRFIATIAFALFGFAFFFYQIPELKNWEVIRGLKLSAHAMPMNFYFNVDKVFVVIVLMGLSTIPLLKTRKQSWTAWKKHTLLYLSLFPT